jgi:hypothetical protein
MYSGHVSTLASVNMDQIKENGNSPFLAKHTFYANARNGPDTGQRNK